MRLSSAFAAMAYQLAGGVSFRISSVLPERFHAGKRACHALLDVRDAPSGPYFARAVLESRWRSRLLLTHVLGLSRAELRRFFPAAVGQAGVKLWLRLHQAPLVQRLDDPVDLAIGKALPVD